MKWINPREQLPELGQLIWILTIENRLDPEKPGLLPCCTITTAEVKKNYNYETLYAADTDRKGHAYGPEKEFYKWMHYTDGSCDHDEERFDSELIVAWAPFNESDLPSWDSISVEESKAILNANEEYKKAVQILEQNKRIEEAAKGQMYFIHLADEKPLRSGIYVVATKNHTALSMYDASSEHPWIVNGEPVIAWYPVPSHY